MNGLALLSGRCASARAAALAATLLAASPVQGQLSRYGLATRVELHMLPAVSTGPMDPSWSPDGRWIAFSMRGDIWKVPAAGGEAIALTRGPGYHFEPAWSPDGERIALSVDLEGNLDLALVDADGGEVVRLTRDPGIDVQPAWSPDGSHLYFTTSRSGDLDIHRIDVGTGEVVAVVEGRGHQFQPAPDPGGGRLAYIARVPGLMGSGGVWMQPLAGGDPTLAHYEETSYRASPRWTPDGAALVYASDGAGSYDIAVVPSAGGNRVRLTEDGGDEFAPAVGPDGATVAFVSNHGGATTLHTMSVGGGPWADVPIRARRHRTPTGTIRGTVVDPAGSVLPARVRLVAADGRAYTPDGGFHRVSPANEIHYFHSTGRFEVEVPAGRATVEALRGFEYVPDRVEVEVPAGGAADALLTLRRLDDPTSRGWYSGDTHAHDLHEGRFGLTQEDFYAQAVADDLHVTNALIHMDGTKVMGRLGDLTGAPYPGFDERYILRYSEEFRGSYGHVGLLGLRRFIMPLIGGAGGSPYAADVLKLGYLDGARAQGGIGGFLHPYVGDVGEVGGAAQADIPIHVALGRGDFFDVVSIASDEMASAAMYYRMLNSGFRIPATGGTDNFSDVWRDPSGGTARTYARIDGPLTFESWIDAVRAGRTVATNGPLLFVTVDGHEPGAEVRLTGPEPRSLSVEADVRSIATFDRVEVVVNGRVERTARPERGAATLRLATTVELPGSGWIAVRVVGGPSPYSGDAYVFAHSTPVHVVRDGRPYVSADDAAFLVQVVDEVWRRVEARDAWRSAEDEDAYRRAVLEARSVLQRRADPASTSRP